MANNEHDQDGDTSQDNASPKYATIEEISEMINKAYTARSKSSENKLSTMLEDFSKKIEEKISNLSSTSKEPSTTEPRIEDNPVYKGMQKKFAELQERLDQAEREKGEERRKARDIELRQRVTDELVKAGLDPNRTRHALALLMDSEKRVTSDDDGTVIFKDLDGSEVDLSTGLRSWAKSDDAKVYMPARGATGSGDRKSPTRQPANKTDTISYEEVGLGLLDLVNKGNI